MTGKFITIVEKNAAFILFAAWITVQCCIFYFTGIQIGGESLKYIGQAYHLVHDHRVDEVRYVFYIIPILLIALIQLLHLPIAAYIFFQISVNAAAATLFYKAAKCLFKNDFAALTATFIFIIFLPYQYWNFFYYTDSFFYSISVFLLYAMVVLKDTKCKTHFLRALLLLVLIFTRPLGILYIIPVGIFYFIKWKINFWIKIFCPAALIILSVCAINFLYRGGGDMNILFPQTEGYVICFEHSIIRPDAANTSISGNPLKDLLNYMSKNPLRFAELAGLRLISFFNLCRPYYSLLHNFYLAISMIFLYVSAIFSLLKKTFFKTKALKYFSGSIFAVFIFGVMLQCDDFNSRFVMPLFPLIILFAVDFWNKFLSKKNEDVILEKQDSRIS